MSDSIAFEWISDISTRHITYHMLSHQYIELQHKSIVIGDFSDYDKDIN